ncbi:MAG: hypothetical protein ABIQ13_12540 [Pedococcus sp.]
MRGQPGRGAFIGLFLGAVAAALVILLPAAMQGLNYVDVLDPLLYIGAPIVVLSACGGAMLGAPAGRPQHEVWIRPIRKPAPAAMVAGAIVLLTICGLAVWVLLWGFGKAPVPPGLS